ncbi:MAG: tetratricopeptide repeat protein, partial [Gammaproteobacteria bacterium]
QSAAILVVKGASSGQPWADRLVDLHIEDSLQPLVELRRLLKLNNAYTHMNHGDHALESGDMEGALEEYGRAQALYPDNLEMKFWHAVSLVNAGRVDESLPIFRAIFSRDVQWRELLLRLADAGLLEADRQVLGRITNYEIRQEVVEHE